MELQDLNLVLNSWFNSARDRQIIRSDIYAMGQNKLMDTLVKSCPPIIATFEAVPDEIVGWVCRDLTRPVTHYVYVKHAYRRTGIGRALAHGSMHHTAHTRAGELLAKAVGSLYNPFHLMLGA